MAKSVGISGGLRADRHHPAPSRQEKMVIGLLPQSLIVRVLVMTLRLATAAVLALGVAVFAGPASAQIFLPRAARLPCRRRSMCQTKNDDLVEAAPPIQAEPLAAARWPHAAAPSYPLPPNSPHPNPPPRASAWSAAAPLIAPAPPIELTRARRPSRHSPPMPPALAARPSDSAPRPPAGVMPSSRPPACRPATCRRNISRKLAHRRNCRRICAASRSSTGPRSRPARSSSIRRTPTSIS